MCSNELSHGKTFPQDFLPSPTKIRLVKVAYLRNFLVTFGGSYTYDKYNIYGLWF